MRRSALRNLTIGLVATVAFGATANFASADDDLGLAAGEHSIVLPGIGDVMITVLEDGSVEVTTSLEGYTLDEDSLEGGDELEFVLTASADPARDVKVEFVIADDGTLSVEGEVKEIDAAELATDDESLDADDDSVDSDDSLDSEPSDDSVDSEPSVDDSDDSAESVDSEPSASDDSEESDDSVDSEPSADDSDESVDSEPSEPSDDE